MNLKFTRFKQGCYATFVMMVMLIFPSVVFGQVSEGFESATTSTPPTGWVFSNVIISSNNPKSGTKTLAFNSTGGYVISPAVTNPKSLKFWYRRSSNSTAWSIKVEVLNSTTNALIATLTPITTVSTTYEEYVADLSSYSNIKIKLTDTRTTGTHERYIDDFEISIPVISSPTVTFQTATNITTTAATLGATITANGGENPTESGIVYATTTSPTIANTKLVFANPVINTPFTVNTSVALTSNTIYYYRGFSTNTAGTGYSTQNTFTTIPGALTATAATSVNSGGFVANWDNPSGNGVITDYRIDVATDNLFVSKIIDDVTAGTTSNYTVTGLTTNTTYYYRIRSVNSGGTSENSNVITVTTTASAAKPSVDNISFSNVAISTATLAAEVISDGGASVTDRGFVFGTIPGNTTNQTTVSGTTGAFTLPVTGLTANTTYYFRAFATNSVGTNYSSESSFTTLPGAPATQASALTFSNVAITGMTVNWTNGNGANRIVVINSANSFTGSYNGTTPAANTTYSGSVEQVIYNGSGNTVTVSGLSSNTTYWFRVYEYNNSGANTIFNTSTATGNPNSQKTNAAPTLVEDFETGTKTSYAAGNVTATTGSWYLDDALLGTASNDAKNGSKSVRLRGSLSMNFNKANGAKSVTFKYAKYTGDADGAIKLEVSNDNGSTWVQYGSDIAATSTTLTSISIPVNLTGDIRIKISRLSGDRINIDDIEITDFVVTCTSPNTQATNVSFSNVTSQQTTLNWTRGNGDGVLVIAKSGSAVSTDAVSGTSYSANASFGSGSVIGSGGYVVYKGTGNSVTVSGLSAQTTYHYAVYEYEATENCYNITELAGNRITLSTEPTAHPILTSSATASDIVKLDFSSPASVNAAGYLILQTSGATAPTTTGITDGNALNISDLPAGTTLAATISTNVTTTTNISGLSGNTQYSFTIIPYGYNGSNANTYNYLTSPTLASTTITTLAPAPEINVKQGTTSYVTSSTFNFGNVSLGNYTDITFTIENLGTANLTISNTSISGSAFSLLSVPTSPIGFPNGTSTFTVRAMPVITGTNVGVVTITNNDADESSYVINFNVTGDASNTSVILADNSFSYPAIISYSTYQSASITTHTQGLEVFRFRVVDGNGSVSDADNLPTKLSGITFSSISGISNIRTAALFRGTTLISGSPVINSGAGTIAFTGLTGIEEDDDNTDGIEELVTLRVTFNSTVTDNDQLQFTITSANVVAASSSVSSTFGSFSNATSDISGNNNKISVVASTIAFGTMPANGQQNSVMSSFTVKAVDSNGNQDKDINSCNIELTTTGTGSAFSSSYGFVNGLVTVSDAIYSTIQSNIKITATAQSCLGNASVTSSSFNISGVTYAVGDYRTTKNGAWGDTGMWERVTALSPLTVTSATPSGSTAIIHIEHIITSGSQTFGSLIVESNAKFTFTGSSTVNNIIQVKNNGELEIAATVILFTTTTFTVEEGGRFTINGANLASNSSFWSGTENFMSGSIIEIKNWNFGAGSGANRLVNGQISANADGYIFGNLEINTAPSQLFGLVNTTALTKLVQNDFTISTTGSNVSFSTSLPNIEIGGNVIINSGTLSGTSSTNSGNGNVTINGNVFLNGGTFNAAQGASGVMTNVVNIKGNLETASGTILTSTDPDSYFNLNNTSQQTINVSGNISGVKINVAGVNVSLSKDLPISASSGNITVDNGGSLDFNNFNVTGSGSFTLAAGGTLKITSANGITSGTTASGNVQCTGTRIYSNTGVYQYTGLSSQVTGNALSGSGARTVIIDNPTQVSLSSNVSISSGGKLNILKGLFIETDAASVSGAGELEMAAGSKFQSSVTSGNVPQLSGTLTLANTSVIELNAAADQTLRGTRSYADLIFSNSGFKYTSSAISTINGTVTIQDNAILDVGSSTFGGTGTNLTMTGGRFRSARRTGIQPQIEGTYNLSAGTVELYNTNFTSSQSLRADRTYFNLEISPSSDLLTSNTVIQEEGTVHVLNNFILGANATYQAGENAIVTGANFSMTDGSGLYYGHADGITDAATGTGTDAGNIRTVSRVFNSNATYGFIGTGNQVTGNGLPSLIQSLVVDKDLLSDVITLSQNLNIATKATFTTGILESGSTSRLTFENGSIVEGASNTSFVSGIVNKIGNESFEFPTGAVIGSKQYYAPVGISAPTNANAEFEAQYFGSGSPFNELTSYATGLDHVSKVEYWDVNRVVGTSGDDDVFITFYWLNGSRSGIKNLSDLTVAHYNSVTSKWEDMGGSATGFISSGSITSGVKFSSFSPMGLGSKTGVNPLPVELLFFNAKTSGERVNLNWATATETDNDYFEVQRSVDGHNFETIQKVRGNGTTTQLQNYATVDYAPLTGTSYYRLKQVDVDGTFAYSKIVSVSVGYAISVYPNPATNVLTVEFPKTESNVTIQVMNGLGQEVRHLKGQLNQKTVFVDIESLPAGAYLLLITDLNKQIKHSFIKQNK